MWNTQKRSVSNQCMWCSPLRQGQPPVQLYFDEQSGLLLRELRYAESPLGLNPTQIDYADYRDVDGVKTPFRWTIARPSGRFTIQLEQVKQNVPIDDAKFVKPPTPPPSDKKHNKILMARWLR